MIYFLKEEKINYSGWFMGTIVWAQNDRHNNMSSNQTISDGLNDVKAIVYDYLLMNHFILYNKSIVRR